MSLSLETFHQRVSRAVRRGKVYDGDIPAHAKDAVRTLEDIHNWVHMWKESFAQTLTAGTSTITLERVKSVRYIRFIPSDDTGWYKYLKKVAADQVGYIDDEVSPSGYWMKSQNVIGLDGASTSDLTYDIGYYQYSEYDDDLAWLEIGENLLIAQTLVEMGPLLKDDRATARWKAAVGERMTSLIEAGLTHEFDGIDQRMIPYADEIDHWLLTGASTD